MGQLTDKDFSQDVSFQYHKCPVRWATWPAFNVSQLRQREVGWFAPSHVLLRARISTPVAELLRGGAKTRTRVFSESPSALHHSAHFLYPKRIAQVKLGLSETSR